jgi:hypothetical protein
MRRGPRAGHPDGKPKLRPAVRTSTGPRQPRRGGAPRWSCHNPVTNYRFLTGGRSAYAWVNGTGTALRDVPDAADFRLVPTSRRPGLAAGRRRLSDLSGPLCALGRRRHPTDPRLGGPRPVGRPGRPVGRRPRWGGSSTAATSTASPSTSTTSSTSASMSSTSRRSSRLAPTTGTTPHLRRGRPVLGGDEALRRLTDAAHGRGIRVLGDFTTNHTGVGARRGSRGARRPETLPSAPSTSSRTTAGMPRGWASARCPSSTTPPGAAPADVRRRAAAWSSKWLRPRRPWTAGGSTSRT